MNGGGRTRGGGRQRRGRLCSSLAAAALAPASPRLRVPPAPPADAPPWRGRGPAGAERGGRSADAAERPRRSQVRAAADLLGMAGTAGGEVAPATPPLPSPAPQRPPPGAAGLGFLLPPSLLQDASPSPPGPGLLNCPLFIATSLLPRCRGPFCQSKNRFSALTGGSAVRGGHSALGCRGDGVPRSAQPCGCPVPGLRPPSPGHDGGHPPQFPPCGHRDSKA